MVGASPAPNGRRIARAEWSAHRPRRMVGASLIELENTASQQEA